MTKTNHVSVNPSQAKTLLLQAKVASEKAYAPYSRFLVGAALLCADQHQTVITATNVENTSYGLTTCAERNAIAYAVSQGHRQFSAIAVWATHASLPQGNVMPCGACRQVMAEFFQTDTQIITADSQGGMPCVHTMLDLLPLGFDISPSNGGV